jgi:hypothetical protein
MRQLLDHVVQTSKRHEEERQEEERQLKLREEEREAKEVLRSVDTVHSCPDDDNYHSDAGTILMKLQWALS